MSKIDTDGFLSKESQESTSYFHDKFPDIFNLAYEINRYSMTYLRARIIDWENEDKLLIYTLFIRTLESFQATILMLERGMVSQAKVLIRAMLEIVFILVALQKKPELTTYYLDQHQESRRKALKAALEFKGEQLRRSAKDQKIEKYWVEHKKFLKNKKLNLLNPKGWAKEAELEDFYNLFYVQYSNSIHSNLSSLEDHVDRTKESLNLSFGPSENYLCEVFQCSIYVILNAFKSTAVSQGVSIENDLDNFYDRIKQIDAKYLKDS